MAYMKRMGVNKRKSARSFRKQTTRTQSRNLSGPMRGGYRL